MMTHRTDCASLVDSGVRPCTCAGPTPPPDAQAMTRKQVEKMVRHHTIGWGPNSKVNPLLAHDAAQRETIRRLEGERDKWKGVAEAKHGPRYAHAMPQLVDENASLQARLTANESKPMWTTARPTVAGFYWFRKGGKKRVVELEFESDGETLAAEGWILIANYWNGEWQGPLTPWEE